MQHLGSSTSRIHTRRRGFTLVELLVVIGVIALLIGILIPVLSRARRSAGQMRCSSNLRQWAMAAHLYATQNDNYLPRRGQGVQPTMQIDRVEDWFNSLPRFVSLKPYSELVATGQTPRAGSDGIWICPQASDAVVGYMFTYGMNMRLSTWSAADPDRIDLVGDASTMVFMADAPSGYCSILPSTAAYCPSPRHINGLNISFLDGHVAWFKSEYVGCGVGDPQHADVRWSVPGSPWAGPAP